MQGSLAATSHALTFHSSAAAPISSTFDDDSRHHPLVNPSPHRSDAGWTHLTASQAQPQGGLPHLHLPTTSAFVEQRAPLPPLHCHWVSLPCLSPAKRV